MRLSALRLTTATLALFGTITTGFGQSSADPINVVTTAVPFLRISPDARAGAMGDMGVATLPDANSAYFNVAKAVFNQSNGGIGVTYTPWLKDLGLNDVYLASLAGYYKFDENQAITGSFRYFSLGNIQFTDDRGNEFGAFRPREFGVDLGYSRKLSEKLGIGLGLRFINSNLVGGGISNGTTNYKPASAVAGDLSLYYNNHNEAGQGVAVGFALTNLGQKIAYTNNADQRDYIPANLSLGTMYTKPFDESNKISFGIELNKLLVPTPPIDASGNISDPNALAAYRNKSVISSWFSSFGDAPGGFKEELKEFQVSVGGEYIYNDQFSVRAGYFWEDKTKGARKYFSMGVGIKYNIFGLNFSYLLPSGNGVNRNPLSNTLRFSILFDLGAAGDGESSTSEE